MVVTVAPSGYTGTADYYCTGVGDDVLINAAIQYVSSAYRGGTVRLLEGQFNDTASIVMRSKVILEGSGPGTILSATGTPFDVVTASSISDVVVRNLKISTGDWNARHIFFSVVTNGIVSGATFVGPALRMIYVLNSSSVMVINNVVDGNLVASSYLDYAIRIETTTQATITGNVVKQLRGTLAAGMAGILIFGTGGAVVGSNQVFDVSLSNAAGGAVGIYCGNDRTQVAANRVEQVKNSGAAANGLGIYATGANDAISSNYCYNNGNDTGIANTNSNNFLDGGTDTQVYSNSWQSPNTGEPEQGELHWVPESTATISGYILNAVTTTAAWSSFSMAGYVPIGAKSAQVTIQVNARASTTGNVTHYVAFSNDTSATPAVGTRHPQFGFVLFNQAGADSRMSWPATIPLDASQKGYYYAHTRTNATVCLIYLAHNGYLS